MADLTIEGLAHETGLTVRSIRNYQSRRLLPPPEVRGRIGYYGDAHVTRLRLIQELQAEGFKLETIKQLIGARGKDPERFIGLRKVVTTPFETEPSEIVSADDLVKRFGRDETALAKAQQLNLLVAIGAGQFETPSPALLRAAEEVTQRGVSLKAALAAIEQVQRSCKSASRAFVDLVFDELWEPFDKAGQPEDCWPEILSSIERLRPIASDALLATFNQTMTAEVEKAFGKALERHAKRSR